MPVPSAVRILAPLVVVVCSALPGVAQEWGAKMLDRTEIRFGSVARLSDTTFKIKVTNPFLEEIQISNLSTSCGCISWQDKLPISIASRQERELTIRLDTIGHAGDKNVRAIISLYEPTKGSASTVTIPVQGRIRSDFEVRPSYVGFGPIDLGKSYLQKITVTYIGGRPGWKIVSAKVSSPHLTAKVSETGRSGGSATFEVVVQIDANAPLGVLRDQLVLTTNEQGESPISIPVDAKVESDIMVTDAQFGPVTPGSTKTMSVIVRGKKPFKIEKVDRVTREVRAKPALDDAPTNTTPASTTPANTTVALTDAIKIKVPEAVAPLQMLTLTLTPPSEPGMFDEEFAIVVEGRPQPVMFKVKGRIVPPEITGTK
ncbi:MAG: DUF1573 domain-containing protein [Planctomycetaceae bacterium]